jgi:hypothetical protein
VNVFLSDVRCVAAGPGCTNAGADFTGRIYLQMPLRLTDHMQQPAAKCTNPQGTAPCFTDTTQDFSMFWEMQCVVNGNPSGGSGPGSTCQATSSFNTKLANIVRFQDRAIFRNTNAITVFDAGPDGQINNGPQCQVSCGTGDENRLAVQGLFSP